MLQAIMKQENKSQCKTLGHLYTLCKDLFAAEIILPIILQIEDKTFSISGEYSVINKNFNFIIDYAEEEDYLLDFSFSTLDFIELIEDEVNNSKWSKYETFDIEKVCTHNLRITLNNYKCKSVNKTVSYIRQCDKFITLIV